MLRDPSVTCVTAQAMSLANATSPTMFPELCLQHVDGEGFWHNI
jgi:hypothetical protein